MGTGFCGGAPGPATGWGAPWDRDGVARVEMFGKKGLKITKKKAAAVA